jgi:protein arginine kinase
LYGENTKAHGNIFQISNQVTLGQTEKDIISNVNNIVKQIIFKEKQVRYELYNQDKYVFEDKLYRAYGLIKNARILGIDEAFKLISDMKLGVDMNIIKEVDNEILNKLIVLMQPANLNKFFEDKDDFSDINIMRAELIRKILK